MTKTAVRPQSGRWTSSSLAVTELLLPQISIESEFDWRSELEGMVVSALANEEHESKTQEWYEFWSEVKKRGNRNRAK